MSCYVVILSSEPTQISSHILLKYDLHNILNDRKIPLMVEDCARLCERG